MSRSRRTALDLDTIPYGNALSGAPLHWIPPRGGGCRVILVAAIHGEEPDTTVCLSRSLRSLEPDEIAPDVGAILCANPDGLQRGTRGNARGIDLNRNFPAKNWSAGPSSCRWHVGDSEELAIGTGSHPASEPETQGLIRLIETEQPSLVIALHGPLGCVDDPTPTAAGRWIASETGLPLVRDIGYPTPGSLGSWAGERGLPVVTWEFPAEGIESLSRTQVPALSRIFAGAAWVD